MPVWLDGCEEFIGHKQLNRLKLHLTPFTYRMRIVNTVVFRSLFRLGVAVPVS